MNIEERLRRDAAAWRQDDSAPDFDAALGRAVPVRRARRPRTTWLVLAAAVVAVGAVVAGVLAWPSLHRAPAGDNDHRYADYLPNNGPTQRDTLVWQRVSNLDFSVAVRVPGHDDRLRVLITGDNGAACSVRRPRVGSITTSSTQVRIDIAGEQLLPEPNGSGGVTGYTCFEDSGRILEVSLGAPLGDRTVVSGTGSGPATVLDPEELPTPAYLPGGYQAAGVQPLRIAENGLTAERDYRNGTDRIMVVIGERDQMPAAGRPVAGHRDVGVALATITQASGTCLTWTIRPSVQTAVCSTGRAVSVATLARVARSLH